MVSQPEQPSGFGLVSHRRGARSTASVVSRPSLSRTKRYNRSHAGGATYLPQNEFPVFANSGDVEIIIRAGPVENRYLLHRHTLTRCSGFFEASTSVEWSKARPLLAGGNELTKVGEDPAVPGTPCGSILNGSELEAGAARRRWCYELDSGAGDGDTPMLVQRDELATPKESGPGITSKPALPSLFGSGLMSKSSSSKSKAYGHSRSHASSTSQHVSFARSVTNLSISGSGRPRLSQADEDLLRDYDNLLRIFYNYHPILDGVNVADAYVQCKSLLALADQYDALTVVGPRVDHHLLQFQSRLWKQIAKYPISYLRLGYLAHSRVIFQEALVHVVGQWPAGERSIRAALPDIVLDIIEDKVDELEETVSRVEGRLFRLNLTTPRGERVSPSTSYLDWLVMSLFRQWLADNTSPQPPPASQSGGAGRSNSGGTGARPALPPPVPALTSVGRAYRAVGSVSPASYLGHEECKRFLKISPELYSRDNLRRFEKRLDELKAMAREIVRPLLGSGLELDMGGTRACEGINYLTCTTVGNRDLPWLMDE